MRSPWIQGSPVLKGAAVLIYKGDMPSSNTPFTCAHCERLTEAADCEKGLWVCGNCGLHTRLRWQERISCTADPGSFEELNRELQTRNPIGFPGYEDKIASLKKIFGTNEGTVTGTCTILG
jgi:acetyl-CoA carboxylase carboxyl transferase subunit beta